VTPAGAALKGLCPRCGAKSLFADISNLAPRCRACGLDFRSIDVGGRPAALLIFIVGALITGLAIGFDRAVRPPFVIHFLLWVPITAVAVAGSLRFAKGMLLALEYKNRAREGRVVEEE
jgi:uncharacterized protein (DUF983 family)